MADWLRARYPAEMTVVIQHWFENLSVTDDGFSVTLNFGNSPEPLVIPFDAVRTFVDPSVEFGLRFESREEEEDEEEEGEEDGDDDPPSSPGAPRGRRWCGLIPSASPDAGAGRLGQRSCPLPPPAAEEPAAGVGHRAVVAHAGAGDDAGLGPQTGRVVEFGPGTGRFTEAILARGVPPANLTLFELDDEFAAHLRARFPGVTVHQRPRRRRPIWWPPGWRR